MKHPAESYSTASSDDLHLAFSSTVLSLRGDSTVQQPYHDEPSGTVLCWNGEAWSIAGLSTSGNDTEAVASLLLQAITSPVGTTLRSNEVDQRAKGLSAALAQIAGPYAFVFYDVVNSILFFGRDFLGRRSLLVKWSSYGELLLSSVSGGSANCGWSEVEADGLYYVDLSRSLGSAAPSANHETHVAGQHIVMKVPYHFNAGDADKKSINVIHCLSLNKQYASAGGQLISAAPAVDRLETLLRRSVSLRVLNIPEPPTAQANQRAPPSPRLAILFSGGLDCTVLARLADDLYSAHNGSIDLLNVAFENPRVHTANTTSCQTAYDLCPDRITGRASCAELKRVCPTRDWRFIAINIPYSETLEHRQRIVTLMHPHNTEMDLSISYALYFAARGQGHLSDTPGMHVPYTTSARVLLSGLGADELFGGYQRHATAFIRNGFSGLLDELNLDIGRLGKRNLGRDDRVISNWGREARYPYLDEDLVAWALRAPVTDKCGFGEAGGAAGGDPSGDGSELLEPGKKVLRCLAWKLGMADVAREKKRAIQFGARTAKMETGKTKGAHLLS